MATKQKTTKGAKKARKGQDPNAAEVKTLIAELRDAAEAKDRQAGKRIRRKLRKLGHRGGLKSAA